MLFPEGENRKYIPQDIEDVFSAYLEASNKTFEELSIKERIYSISFRSPNGDDFCTLYFMPYNGGTVIEKRVVQY